MKMSISGPTAPTSFLNFLAADKQECDCDEVPKSAAMWCVKRFIIKSPAAYLAARLYIQKKSSNKPESLLSFSKEVVYRFFGTYATEDVTKGNLS